MKIQINSYQNFKALVPFSKYKGPVLKLTEEEVSKVASLEAEIAQLVLEKMKISDYLARTKSKSDALVHNFSTQDYVIDSKIDFLREQIRQIKINRITQQRNSL